MRTTFENNESFTGRHSTAFRSIHVFHFKCICHIAVKMGSNDAITEMGQRHLLLLCDSATVPVLTFAYIRRVLLRSIRRVSSVFRCSLKMVHFSFVAFAVSALLVVAYGEVVNGVVKNFHISKLPSFYTE